MSYKTATFALAALAGSCNGQTTFLPSPVSKWTTTFLPMGQGNGVVMAPDGSTLYATALDGSVGAMDPSDGSIKWTFKPVADVLDGNGQVSVASDHSYLVYGVTENLGLTNEACLVVALSPSTGAPLWVSAPLDGACQGTPHISSNGKFIFVTHNSGGSTVGHFTVLAHGPDAATVLYETTDTKGPFSPPGIFYSPIEGNFATGRGNNQDVLIWSHSPSPDATNGEGGSMLAFQLPRNYVPNLSTDILDVTIVNPAVTWRSTSPPLLTAGGLQLFWPVSRGQLRSWVNTRFSASSSGNIGFDRGVPSWLAPQNTPAVDNDVTPTILCAGGAALEFACMNAADITAGAIWSVDLSGIVLSNPLFSTEGDRVYFAEDRGVVFSVNPQNGDKYFEKSTGAPLFSNFCLSGDGAFLYYGDQIGHVVAWKVGEESTSPTLAPEPTLVPMPTVSPPEEQSMAPTGEMIAPISPTSSPTTERVESPTAPAPTAVPPTRAPVASPTKSPVTSSAAVAGAIGALLQAGVVLVLGM